MFKLKFLAIISITGLLTACANNPHPRIGIATPATISIEYYSPEQLTQASMLAQNYCDGIGKNAQFTTKEGPSNGLIGFGPKVLTAYFSCVPKGQYEIGGTGPVNNYPCNTNGTMPVILNHR